MNLKVDKQPLEELLINAYHIARKLQAETSDKAHQLETTHEGLHHGQEDVLRLVDLVLPAVFGAIAALEDVPTHFPIYIDQRYVTTPQPKEDSTNEGVHGSSKTAPSTR